MTALHIAVTGSAAVLEFLLKKGAKLNIANVCFVCCLLIAYMSFTD